MIHLLIIFSFKVQFESNKLYDYNWFYMKFLSVRGYCMITIA